MLNPFLRILLSFVLLLAFACKERDAANIDSKVQATADLNPSSSFYNAGNRNIKWGEEERFLGIVQPVLAKRCAVCHACSDSPCSLKLTSHEGFARGASKANPYSVHVGEQDYPSDVVGAKGFFAVHDNALSNSMMFQFIKLGAANNVSSSFKLDANASLVASHAKATFSCPANGKEFLAYANANPMGGMPFGLPALPDDQHVAIMSWLAETGGDGPSAKAKIALQQPSRQDVIWAWDNFLNFDKEGLRAKLMARYLYEHVFDAHVVFDEMPGEFFRLVRSKKAPPQGDSREFRPFEEINTALPTDYPQIGGLPFFYRFQKITDVITQKNNVVFKISLAMIDHYRQLFFPATTPWSVDELPGYDTPDVFQNFVAMPPLIRHRFMLENARYIVDSMVRAPVCKGESATFAIADHFWVYFLRPEADVSSGARNLMSKEGFAGLDLKVTAWTKTGQIEDRFVRNYTYLTEYENMLRTDLKNRGKTGLGIDDLWLGEPFVVGGPNSNPNAWLSITRHDTSTTVQYGHEGGMPQSMWVLSYANFERLYYNLVANFKYWGALDHKLGTWRSMSHERMDGEDLFLSMLPIEEREAVRREWSGGLELGEDLGFLGPIMAKIINLKTGIAFGNKAINRYLDLYPLQASRGPKPRDTGVSFSGDIRADFDLARQIRDRMRTNGVITGLDDLNADPTNENIQPPQNHRYKAASIAGMKNFAAWESTVKQVLSDRGRGRYAAYLPALTWLRVKGDGGTYRVYSLIGNRGYKSHNISLLSSSATSSPVREVSRDTISIYRGIVGDYPQMFLDVDLAEGISDSSAAALLKQVQALSKENYAQVFTQIRSQFGIERNNAKFWPFVDWLHDWMLRTDTAYGPGIIYAGIIDLSKYGYYYAPK